MLSAECVAQFYHLLVYLILEGAYVDYGRVLTILAVFLLTAEYADKKIINAFVWILVQASLR